METITIIGKKIETITTIVAIFFVLGWVICSKSVESSSYKIWFTITVMSYCQMYQEKFKGQNIDTLRKIRERTVGKPRFSQNYFSNPNQNPWDN